MIPWLEVVHSGEPQVMSLRNGLIVSVLLIRAFDALHFW